MDPTSGSNKEGSKAIDVNLLIQWGGVIKNYVKDECIFREGQKAHFYHQVIEGKIQMINEGDNGKDFIQGFFSAGESFGEPPIFEGGEYPASAIAVLPSVIIRLSIPSFTQLLKENFDVHWSITKLLSKRIQKKATNLKAISSYNPEYRILTLLNYVKKEKLEGVQDPQTVRIDYTRQQIAAMTGLRVETVIRVMRNLQNNKILTIEHGKVYY